MIGARIYYVAFSWDMYRDNLMDIFKIWNGGIGIYGGVIAAVLSGWLLCRWRKVRFLPMLDLCSAGLDFGGARAIGRWGEFCQCGGVWLRYHCSVADDQRICRRNWLHTGTAISGDTDFC